MAPGGELYILINLYKDNHYSLRWVEELKVPVQVKSEQEYIDLFKAHGFGECARRAHSGPVADAGGVQRKVVQERRGAARLQAHRSVVADRAQAWRSDEEVKAYSPQRHGGTEKGNSLLRIVITSDARDCCFPPGRKADSSLRS